MAREDRRERCARRLRALSGLAATVLVLATAEPALPADDAGAGRALTGTEGDWVAFVGEVRNVEGRTFTLVAGDTRIKVDTDQMPEDPFVHSGTTQAVKAGDRVRVEGTVDDKDIIEDRELDARVIVHCGDGAC